MLKISLISFKKIKFKSSTESYSKCLLKIREVNIKHFSLKNPALNSFNKFFRICKNAKNQCLIQNSSVNLNKSKQLRLSSNHSTTLFLIFSTTSQTNTRKIRFKSKWTLFSQVSKSMLILTTTKASRIIPSKV